MTRPWTPSTPRWALQGLVLRLAGHDAMHQASFCTVATACTACSSRAVLFRGMGGQCSFLDSPDCILAVLSCDVDPSNFHAAVWSLTSLLPCRSMQLW